MAKKNLFRSVVVYAAVTLPAVLTNSAIVEQQSACMPTIKAKSSASACPKKEQGPIHDGEPKGSTPVRVDAALPPGVAGANARMMMHEASRKRRAWADEPELWTRRNEPLYALLAHRQAAEKA